MFLLNKYTLIIVLLIIFSVISFIMGAKLNPKIVKEIEYKSVIDQNAINLAVREERENILKSMRQVKFKETLKMPNGSTKIIEKTEITKEEKSDFNSLVNKVNNIVTHESIEKKEIVTTPFSHFRLGVFTNSSLGFEDYRKLTTYKFKQFAGINFIYNITPNFSSQLRYSYEFMQQKHAIGAEFAYYFNF